MGAVELGVVRFMCKELMDAAKAGIAKILFPFNGKFCVVSGQPFLLPWRHTSLRRCAGRTGVRGLRALALVERLIFSRS